MRSFGPDEKQRSSRTRFAATAALGLVLAVGSAACGGSEDPPRSAKPTPSASASSDADQDGYARGIPADGVFAATSPWRADVREAPTSPASSAQVTNLVTNLAKSYGGVAAFNIYQYNVAWYTVGPTQPTTTVVYTDCQGKTGTPAGLYGPGGQFEDVPVPDDAVPTTGTDSALTVYQPSTDTLWNLWKAKRTDGRWHACWGGRIEDVSTSSTQFTGSFGASASGLAYEAGAVSVNDVQSGSIDHAMALGIPFAVVSDVVSWPATRTDGRSGAADAISEGARLRLDPKLDVAGLGLSPIATMIAVAAQRYGFIVTDEAGTVGVPAESPVAEKQVTGSDPWVALLQGRRSYNVLEKFPWDRLEVLPRDYGRP